VNLLRPTASASHLSDLLEMRLDCLLLPAEVTALQLHAVALQPLECRQHTLTGAACDDDRALAVLLERLSSRLGEEAVLRPQLLPEHQPENAFRLFPALRPWPSLTGASPLPGPRPLCLKSRPIPLDVASLIPHGPPLRFHWKGTDHTVARRWGPERIETGWWRNEHVCRDYYRVETAEGRQFWLFRDRVGKRWLLHGIFE
jgi:protein ImuB